jgi:hypothetical protein
LPAQAQRCSSTDRLRDDLSSKEMDVRGRRAKYSNLEDHESPLSPRNGPLFNQQQQAMRSQQQQQQQEWPQRGASAQPRAASSNPFEDPLRSRGGGTASSVDHRGASAVATGAVGMGYGPYTAIAPGSTSSLNGQGQDRGRAPAPPRTSSRDPSPQPRYRQDGSTGQNSAVTSAASSPERKLKKQQQGPSPLLKNQGVFTARDAIIDARLHDMDGKDDYDNPTCEWTGPRIEDLFRSELRLP